jgi:hypothetical protein
MNWKEYPQCRKTIRRNVMHLLLMIDNSVKMMVIAKKKQGKSEEFSKSND